MTAVFCANKSPRRLCEEVEKVIPPDFGRVVRRPFNHYTPTLTDWWMVPSLELPFFKFGKYAFFWDADVRDSIACGLFLSKGLDPALRSVYPSRKGRRLIMDDTWAWHEFLPAALSGELTKLIRSAADGCPLPWRMVFDGGYVDDPGLFEPRNETNRRDRYELEYDVGNDSWRVLRAKREAMCLKFLNRVRDSRSLAAAFETLRDESFLWCDVWIGVRPAVREYGEFAPGETVWDAREIYERVLAPFRRFVH